MGQNPARQIIPMRCESLVPGMFVAGLDRSWLHTPFEAGGFVITSRAQIEKLCDLCHHVFIDPERSEPVPPAGVASAGSAVMRRVPVATIMRSLVADVDRIVRGARQQEEPDHERLRSCADTLVDLAVSDPDALRWHLHVAASGSYFYRRAIGTAATALTLGLGLGLERAALAALATGGLLLDLGKVAVPVPILAKPGALDDKEQAYVRRHVERSLELAAGYRLTGRALEMIAGHHERIDGSGYPQQLAGTQIPLFARIAAIADAFDAMTLDRRYAAAMAPHSALAQLDHLRDRKFDAGLVVELVHALGIYPVGTAVELADGRCGLVWQQRSGHPLEPHVAITHGPDREQLPAHAMADAREADIVRCLPPQALAFDAARLLTQLRAGAARQTGT